MLYRCTSQKSRTPISEPMYQPLKGHPVNSRPPTSSSMLATAGSAYHFRSSSLNHSYLLNKHFDHFMCLFPLWAIPRKVQVDKRVLTLGEMTCEAQSAKAQSSFPLQCGNWVSQDYSPSFHPNKELIKWLITCQGEAEAEMQLSKSCCLLWMLHWNFEDNFWRDLKYFWVLAVCLENKGNDIKAAVFRLPPKLNAQL